MKTWLRFADALRRERLSYGAGYRLLLIGAWESKRDGRGYLVSTESIDAWRRQRDEQDAAVAATA